VPLTNLNGKIGRQLGVTLIEDVFPYEPSKRRRWKSSRYEGLLPDEEKPRYESKYKASPPGTHFVQLTAMAELKQQGWQWAYEDYCLFHDVPAEDEPTHRAGTQKMIELLGAEVVAEVRRVGEIYQKGELKPVEPDLIAWRDVDGRREWQFIEVLIDGDALRKGQLLGLTILALVTKGQSAVWRFIDYDKWVDYRNKVKRPKEHKDRFGPRAASSESAEAAPEPPSSERMTVREIPVVSPALETPPAAAPEPEAESEWSSKGTVPNMPAVADTEVPPTSVAPPPPEGDGNDPSRQS
jgi:hypothetical protein